ncbi:leucyl/phenylalanyl-tRNA--protein transferase [Rhodoblastus sphagnicola]|uniref:Leucyl/phenylalanyl-tRNA--protein transferase n=1 Tax=Rhodoblastus sphagnicola TaxID=333368 RepID=A0A2S6N4L5_9HYPH|nr:leucyl/phenylalanyl-tRNA--protein transferase [Rhodoblastus sphagnicola]MBB4196374.1 leucyl/phenylalanyl-tRNA--protein transferase [Rhodoblastus sphagnicola]PPQ29539.1 leucyl/phenylalanyl-tRNA--protein transferase [Rhodoblastus sphagnicola]
MSSESDAITPEILLRAYAAGLFPMADDADDDDLSWFDPSRRGIFPLDGFCVSKSLAKAIKGRGFDIRVDSDFFGVLAGCAESKPGREKTWINRRIAELYGALFAQGYVHTVEAWRDDVLVGGLYGVAIGGAFCGESMFHRATDASKICLTYLVARLKRGGFSLLDTQFITPHLASLGAVEISRAAYRRRLRAALQAPGDFAALAADAPPETILELARGDAAAKW